MILITVVIVVLMKKITYNKSYMLLRLDESIEEI